MKQNDFRKEELEFELARLTELKKSFQTGHFREDRDNRFNRTNKGFNKQIKKLQREVYSCH